MKDYIKSNKDAWNEAFSYHKKARGNSLEESFKNSDWITFDDSENDKKLLEIIKKLKLNNKKIAHFQTNNGRELISLLRVTNAAEGVGFDISNEAISEGKKLAEIANVNARFECGNLFDIDSKYNGYFDMIYITESSLSWLPDMNKYFQFASRLLKNGGVILMSEIHPIGFVFDKDTDKPVRYDDIGPYKMLSGLDYVGEVDYQPKDCYYFMHKLSDIFMAMIDNGFSIDYFKESTADTGWIDPKNEHPELPRSFVVLAKKQR